MVMCHLTHFWKDVLGRPTQLRCRTLLSYVYGGVRNSSSPYSSSSPWLINGGLIKDKNLVLHKLYNAYGHSPSRCSTTWPISNLTKEVGTWWIRGSASIHQLPKSSHPVPHSSFYARHFASSTSSDYHKTAYTDIDENSWIRIFPRQVQPYLILARVDRPIGYWVLFLPCSWSISLTAQPGSLPDLKLLTLFLAGSLLMRSAGCVINDLWDRDLDAKVERTANRPLASAKINPFQGLVFLAGQLTIALGILLSFNNFSIVLGASSLLLVTTYPLMKRITFWPQFFLGATMNWGCLLGWSAVNGSLDLSICLPLYVAAINWTLVYDTIYSFQDVKCDSIAGIKSTGLLFGDKTKTYLTIFGSAMVANLLLVGINSSQTWPFYLGLLGVTSHLTWQISQVNLSQPKDCLSKFISNKWLGIILFLSIVASAWMKPKATKNEVKNQQESTIKSSNNI